ncbi:MAG: hypothetical protein QNJ38_16065 [Prochloraceae cyanobacterium]|nr:hypothetical protein [Prochloraceae cyanobacterium]
MPRPGGNPNIKKHGFKTDRVEPLTTQLALKVSASMKKQLKEKENWQEFVRNAIAKALEEDDLQSA